MTGDYRPRDQRPHPQRVQECGDVDRHWKNPALRLARLPLPARIAIAMGIGRFAFTPMMPLMVRDGSLDAVTGTEWATANYVGYLLRAISASWFARSPRRGLQVGLVGVAATTLAMAWA